MPSYLGNISSVHLNKLVNDLENIEFDNLDTNFHEHLTLRPYFVHYNEYSYLSCRFIIFVRFKFKKDSTFLKAIKFRSPKPKARTSRGDTPTEGVVGHGNRGISYQGIGKNNCTSLPNRNGC